MGTDEVWRRKKPIQPELDNNQEIDKESIQTKLGCYKFSPCQQGDRTNLRPSRNKHNEPENIQDVHKEYNDEWGQCIPGYRRIIPKFPQLELDNNQEIDKENIQ